jgi:hypothetical protein
VFLLGAPQHPHGLDRALDHLIQPIRLAKRRKQKKRENKKAKKKKEEPQIIQASSTLTWFFSSGSIVSSLVGVGQASINPLSLQSLPLFFQLATAFYKVEFHPKKCFAGIQPTSSSRSFPVF